MPGNFTTESVLQSFTNELKLKVRKCLVPIPTFLEVTGEQLVGFGGELCTTLPPPPLFPAGIGLMKQGNEYVTAN